MSEKTLPLVPLRGTMIFPTMVIYFDIGRSKSVEALEHAMANDQELFLVTQKLVQTEDPTPEDYYHIGTVVKVKQMLKLPGDTIRVLVEGIRRARILDFTPETSFIEVYYEDLETIRENEIEERAYAKSIREAYKKYAVVSGSASPEITMTIDNLDDIEKLAYMIAADLSISLGAKQDLLEEDYLKVRLDLLLKFILEQIQINEIEHNISTKVKSAMSQNQKEFILKEQMRAIQEELGQGPTNDIEDYYERLEKLRLKKDIHKKVSDQIDKLKTLNPSSPETHVIRTYIEWILDLPWRKQTKENIDLKKARKILDRDHYSLDEVKDRIIEYLAVRKLKGSMKGPIICLVGPPGVGKTSIARSIADSVNRKFIRMSLGGVGDEAEIRGHRRTYIGAIPGRIMTLLKEVQSKNPLFLFDEIDKLTTNFKGDPASALLEVLDPEQNKAFVDNYLEIPFDLSKVMFITTANTTNTIPRPLLDRMEVIEISGYTFYEKMQIAKKYLVPKQLDENGIKGNFEVSFTDEALSKIIESYTRESGVRQLERTIAKVLRKVASKLLQEDKKELTVDEEAVGTFLGREKFKNEFADQEDKIGIVTGLAWTSVGGTTLPVEVNVMSGKGKLVLTGQLGDVMKESAQAGLSYIRSKEKELHIDKDFFKENDIHIHSPEGAVPKDGPSAGITMVTAMVSAITKTKVRSDVAMTGEITLRGRVLPIGGLKEKILAAKRFGIKTILVPEANMDAVDEIHEDVKQGLEIIPVKDMTEVLKEALVHDQDQTK